MWTQTTEPRGIGRTYRGAAPHCLPLGRLGRALDPVTHTTAMASDIRPYNVSVGDRRMSMRLGQGEAAGEKAPSRTARADEPLVGGAVAGEVRGLGRFSGHVAAPDFDTVGNWRARAFEAIIAAWPGGRSGDARCDRAERTAIPGAGQADGGRLRRRMRPDICRARHRRWHSSDDRRVSPAGLSRHGGCRGADLHQSEQRVDRDRGAAFGSRHCRQLLSRPRKRARDHDDRRPADARRDDPRFDGARGCRDRGDHGKGQAAQAARA